MSAKPYDSPGRFSRKPVAQFHPARKARAAETSAETRAAGDPRLPAFDVPGGLSSFYGGVMVSLTKQKVSLPVDPAQARQLRNAG